MNNINVENNQSNVLLRSQNGHCILIDQLLPINPDNEAKKVYKMISVFNEFMYTITESLTITIKQLIEQISQISPEDHRLEHLLQSCLKQNSKESVLTPELKLNLVKTLNPIFIQYIRSSLRNLWKDEFYKYYKSNKDFSSFFTQECKKCKQSDLNSNKLSTDFVNKFKKKDTLTAHLTDYVELSTTINSLIEKTNGFFDLFDKFIMKGHYNSEKCYSNADHLICVTFIDIYNDMQPSTKLVDNNTDIEMRNRVTEKNGDPAHQMRILGGVHGVGYDSTDSINNLVKYQNTFTRDAFEQHVKGLGSKLGALVKEYEDLKVVNANNTVEPLLIQIKTLLESCEKYTKANLTSIVNQFKDVLTNIEKGKNESSADMKGIYTFLEAFVLTMANAYAQSEQHAKLQFRNTYKPYKKFLTDYNTIIDKIKSIQSAEGKQQQIIQKMNDALEIKKSELNVEKIEEAVIELTAEKIYTILAYHYDCDVSTLKKISPELSDNPTASQVQQCLDKFNEVFKVLLQSSLFDDANYEQAEEKIKKKGDEYNTALEEYKQLYNETINDNEFNLFNTYSAKIQYIYKQIQGHKDFKKYGELIASGLAVAEFLKFTKLQQEFTKQNDEFGEYDFVKKKDLLTKLTGQLNQKIKDGIDTLTFEQLSNEIIKSAIAHGIITADTVNNQLAKFNFIRTNITIIDKHYSAENLAKISEHLVHKGENQYYKKLTEQIITLKNIKSLNFTDLKNQFERTLINIMNNVFCMIDFSDSDKIEIHQANITHNIFICFHLEIMLQHCSKNDAQWPSVEDLVNTYDECNQLITQNLQQTIFNYKLNATYNDNIRDAVLKRFDEATAQLGDHSICARLLKQNEQFNTQLQEIEKLSQNNHKQNKFQQLSEEIIIAFNNKKQSLNKYLYMNKVTKDLPKNEEAPKNLPLENEEAAKKLNNEQKIQELEKKHGKQIRKYINTKLLEQMCNLIGAVERDCKALENQAKLFYQLRLALAVINDYQDFLNNIYNPEQLLTICKKFQLIIRDVAGKLNQHFKDREFNPQESKQLEEIQQKFIDFAKDLSTDIDTLTEAFEITKHSNNAKLYILYQRIYLQNVSQTYSKLIITKGKIFKFSSTFEQSVTDFNSILKTRIQTQSGEIDKQQTQLEDNTKDRSKCAKEFLDNLQLNWEIVTKDDASNRYSYGGDSECDRLDQALAKDYIMARINCLGLAMDKVTPQIINNAGLRKDTQAQFTDVFYGNEDMFQDIIFANIGLLLLNQSSFGTTVYQNIKNNQCNLYKADITWGKIANNLKLKEKNKRTYLKEKDKLTYSDTKPVIMKSTTGYTEVIEVDLADTLINSYMQILDIIQQQQCNQEVLNALLINTCNLIVCISSKFNREQCKTVDLYASMEQGTGLKYRLKQLQQASADLFFYMYEDCEKTRNEQKESKINDFLNNNNQTQKNTFNNLREQRTQTMQNDDELMQRVTETTTLNPEDAKPRAKTMTSMLTHNLPENARNTWTQSVMEEEDRFSGVIATLKKMKEYYKRLQLTQQWRR